MIDASIVIESCQNGSLNRKCPIIRNSGVYEKDLAQAFEKMFFSYPTETPFMASEFMNGYWMIFGFIYKGRSYGIIYGSCWNGAKHRCICQEGVFNHTKEW